MARIQLDVGATDQGAETGNGTTLHPRADYPELRAFTDKVEVVRLDADTHVHVEIVV